MASPSQVQSGSSLKRFAEVSTGDDLKLLRYSKGTISHTESAKKLFVNYLNVKNFVVDRSTSDFKANLDSQLHDFLLSVRKETGEQYAIGGFEGVFYSLARYIFEEYSFDLLLDPVFVKTKIARKTVRGILKKSGKGYVHHTDVIIGSDLEKIANLDISTPQNLQLKAWFLIQFHLALRGRENSHEITKDDIIISTENYVKYIELRDMMTKNHRGETSEKSNNAKMFSTSASNCPVQCVEQYLSKLHPDNKYIWQRPKRNYQQSCVPWYDNQKIGINKIGTFMKTMCEVAGLSKIYSNHSPRATCITILGTTYQDTDVASHSGHKSLSAMSIYKRTSDETRKDMSHTLTSTMHMEKASHTTLTSSSTVDQPCYDAHVNCCLSIGAESSAENVSEPVATAIGPIMNQPELSNIPLLEMAEIDTQFDRFLAQFNCGHVDNIGSTCVQPIPPNKTSLPRNFVNCSFNNCTFN